MKALSLSLLTICILSLTNCKDNSSYPEYTQIKGKYIKNYLKHKQFENNKPYFHKDYGIIKYENNFWRDQNNAILYELGQR